MGDLLVIGDSFCAPTSGLTMWPDLISQRIGRKVWNHAVGSTGYMNPGNLPNTPPARFLRQLLHHPDLNPAQIELVIVFGSINDRSWGANDAYRMGVWLTLRTAQLEYPSAKLQVVLPQWAGTQGEPIERRTMMQAVADQMWSMHWEPNGYLDPCPDDKNQWLFPPWATNMIGPDNFHPNQAGQTHIADWIEPRIRQILGI